MSTRASYRDLARLSRDQFLRSAAPAVLVRTSSLPTQDQIETTLTMEERSDGQGQVGGLPELPRDAEIYPIAKKPGAAFSTMVTLGRTTNNDIAIADPSISRLHCYVKYEGGRFAIADGGSKNGTQLNGIMLSPRREIPIEQGARIRLGDVTLYFCTAYALFDLLQTQP